jgi:hypothetical protein
MMSFGGIAMQVKPVKGFITRERWLLCKTPKEMSRLLGFEEGRMSEGAKVYALIVLPTNEQFEFAGHTHWSGGEPVGRSVDLWPPKHAEIDKRWMRSPEVRAKDNVRSSWSLSGSERLIKIVPNKPHVENVSQYPVGAGVEQWILLVELPAVLVKELRADERYRP